VSRLQVATLNIRNLADRWDERLPLILADMAALQPDVLGLQEVVYVLQQDRLIGAGGEGRYESTRGWAGRPEYGNATLVRQPLVATDVERLDLGLSRSAIRSRIALPDRGHLAVTVTHLHHLPDDKAERDGQVEQLVAWLADRSTTSGRPPADGEVVMGDFNADPSEPAYARMGRGGFRSASIEANGREPDVTWPSGLEAPFKDDDGEARCLDYIWVQGAIKVDACRLAFDRPAVGDPGLYPSDHLGLAARLTVG